MIRADRFCLRASAWTALGLLTGLFGCGDDGAAGSGSAGTTGDTTASSSSGGTTIGTTIGTSTGTSEDVPLPPEEVLWSDRMLNIAHAGGKGTRPEHTMVAYETALADGADVLELDVHATADGELILMHDETVDRTTDGTGRIRDMTLAELKQLDAGYRFTTDDGATYPYRGMGLTVPTLAETFEAFPDMPYVIEIKQGTPSIVEPFLTMCEQHGIDDQMVASGFDIAVVEEIRAFRPDMPTGFALAEVVEFMGVTQDMEAAYVPPGEFLQVPIMQGPIEVLDQPFVDKADRLGLKVHAWTINDETEMRMLIEWGVDGIITDFPARLETLP